MIKKNLDIKMNKEKNNNNNTNLMGPLNLINPQKMYNNEPTFTNLTLLHKATIYVMNHLKTPEITFKDIAQKSTKEIGISITTQFVADIIIQFKEYIPHYETLYSQIPKKEDGTLNLSVLDNEILNALNYETAVVKYDKTKIKSKIYHVIISWKYKPILIHEFLNILSDIRNSNSKKDYTRIIFYMLDAKIKYKDNDYLNNIEVETIEKLIANIKEYKMILNKVAFRSKTFSILTNELFALQKKLISYCQQTALPEIYRDMDSTSLYVDPKDFRAFLESIPPISGLYFDVETTIPNFKAIKKEHKTEKLVYLNCEEKDFNHIPEMQLIPELKNTVITIKSQFIQKESIIELPSITPILKLDKPNDNIDDNNS